MNLIDCCCLVAQLCPTLCNPMDCSPSGPSVREVSQARILEWVAISSSKGSSPPRDQIQISYVRSPFLQKSFPTAPWYSYKLPESKYCINSLLCLQYPAGMTWEGAIRVFAWAFPGGPVDKNPPANAGEMGSIPDLRRFHMLRATKHVCHNPRSEKISHAEGN